jgi:pimeloyl-ACP methyl ester carboxylesterase
MQIAASDITLRGGLRLALRTAAARSADAAGTGRAFLLVHGLASNARLWDAVATRLADAGHTAVSVDQRGHGLSAEPPGGYDTDTCADDLADLIAALGLERPVVAGQSWGGNVVLALAARHPASVGAVCCVDGGWLRPTARWRTFDECWAVLEPPRMDAWRWDDVERRVRDAMRGWPDDAADAALANLLRRPDGGVRARLARAHHKDIVRSIFEGDPRELYPRIQVPVLLCPAVGATEDGSDDEQRWSTHAAVQEALALLPIGDVRWFPGAHHDLHAQQPDALVQALLTLAEGAP